jgi:hypothetical protein
MSDDQFLDPKTGSDGAAGKAVPADIDAQYHKHDHQVVPSDPALRTKALESLLVEKGLVDPAAFGAVIDTYESKIGPRNGARFVARTWVDPAYKERLVRDAGPAIPELGYSGALSAKQKPPSCHRERCRIVPCQNRAAPLTLLGFHIHHPEAPIGVCRPCLGAHQVIQLLAVGRK